MNDLTTYDDALNWLNSFINLEKKRSDQYRPEAMTLDRPRRLLHALDDPHRRYPSIHIAGTKGKGSTAAMCAAALQAAGYRVGLYTSPHLHDVRERFRVLTPADPDGRVSGADFVELVRHVRPAVEAEPALTWFEIFTALAFLHFSRAGVDVAVVEVGLGGRLDATNVLTPLVTVITRVSLDHMALLGDTLEAIAREKGGIIKPGIPLISAPQEPAAAAAIAEIATARGAPLWVVGEQWQYGGEVTPGSPPRSRLTIHGAPAGQTLLSPPQTFDLALLGAHQRENGAVAVAALAAAHPSLPQLTAGAVARGLTTVHWPGRLQIVDPGPPPLVADAAHNGESAQRLVAALRESFSYRRLWLIFGAGIDKDIEGMFDALLPAAAALLVVRAPHPRAASTLQLQEMARDRDRLALPFPTIAGAVAHARRAAGPGDLICVTGSLFVVAQVLE
jgi:dihydrofolate synthase/folylpolyglutamate synthase